MSRNCRLSVGATPGLSADPLPAWPARSGEILQGCIDHWRTQFDVILMHAGDRGRRFVLTQLPDVLVLRVADWAEVGELAALAYRAAATRDGQPYDVGMLLVLPVPVAPVEVASTFFRSFVRYWLHRAVTVEAALEAIAVSEREIAVLASVARVAALVVRDFAGTPELGRDPDGYVGAAAAPALRFPSDLRSDALSVLADLATWEADKPSWADVGDLLDTMSAALLVGDQDGLASAVTRLKLMGLTLAHGQHPLGKPVPSLLRRHAESVRARIGAGEPAPRPAR